MHQYILQARLEGPQEKLDEIAGELMTQAAHGFRTINYLLDIGGDYTIEQSSAANFLYYIHRKQDRIVKICIYVSKVFAETDPLPAKMPYKTPGQGNPAEVSEDVREGK